MDTENLKYTHNKCATQKFVHERVFNYQLLNEQARLFVYTDYWELFKGNSFGRSPCLVIFKISHLCLVSCTFNSNF